MTPLLLTEIVSALVTLAALLALTVRLVLARVRRTRAQGEKNLRPGGPAHPAAWHAGLFLAAVSLVAAHAVAARVAG